MPSFSILCISVVRFNPSLAAAPFGPPITQRTDSSVRKISLRSESFRVVVAKDVVAVEMPAAGKDWEARPRWKGSRPVR